MNILRRITPLILCACLLFSGCSTLSSAMGTLRIDVADVSNISITNASGQRFSTQDQEKIRSIVDAVNRLTLDQPGDGINGYRYALSLEHSDGSTSAHLTLVDESIVCHDGVSYSVDARSLLRRIEALECDFLTDEELIRTLFESDYLSDLTILGDDGRISLDKITRLSEEFPVLFEIIGRPSALESLGTYGLELLEEYLNSNDINLRQRAQQVAEFISAVLPQLKEKIDGILETSGK